MKAIGDLEADLKRFFPLSPLAGDPHVRSTEGAEMDGDT